MVKPRFVAGIDFGCTKVCAIAAEVDGDGRLGGVLLSTVAAHGLHRGTVVNREAAAAAIAEALDELQAASRRPIESVTLGISTAVDSSNSRGSVTTTHPRRPITPDDVKQAVEAAAAAADLPKSHQVVHVVARSFMVDGQSGISNPVGLFGRRIDAEAHVVTVAEQVVRTLAGCIERWGAEVQEVVAQPLAVGQAVLSTEERELGAAAADLGAACTGLSIFVEGNPWRTATIPVGGRHLTQDVATVLGISYDVAEELKLSAGRATAASIDAGEELVAASEGGAAPFRIARRELCAIIEARARELIDLIGEEIRRSGYAGLLPAGLVLTGGTAQLPGIARLASEMLQLRVRTGQPELAGAVTRARPAQASAVGLLLWASHSATVGRRTGLASGAAQAPTRHQPAVGRWLRALWPAARSGKRSG